MKRIWRNCLLTAGLLASGSAAARGDVIARTPHTPGPVAAVPDGTAPPASDSNAIPDARPLGVSLDRPRVIATTGAPAVMPAAFRGVESTEPAPLIRSQKQDFRAMPAGPGPVTPPPIR